MIEPIKTIRMFKNLLLTGLLAIAFCFQSQAQCAGCMADTLCSTIKPGGGVCDSILPDATAGTYYSTDVTFYMPKTITVPIIGSADLVEVRINGVTGLPFGMNWECDSSTSGCTYDPQAMPIGKEVGCIRFCGTPIGLPGLYKIKADLTIKVDAGTAGIVSEDTAYYMDLRLLASAGGATTFTFTPTFGCDSLTSNFCAILDGSPQPTTWDWTFGDGGTDTGKKVSHFYSAPGTYMVVLKTTIFDYVLNSVNVLNVNNDWCGDVEEAACTCGGFISFCPDLYTETRNSVTSLIHGTSTASAGTSASWTVPSVPLYSPPYSITVFDDDPVSADDNLGTFAFNPTSAGTITLSGGGTSLNVGIGLVVDQVVYDTTWITVGTSPIASIMSSADSFCTGDSVLLTTNSGLAGYQWYDTAGAITGANSNTYYATKGGMYNVVISDSIGCTDNASISVVEVPLPPKPTFVLSSSGDQLINTSASGWDLQWCKDGSPIAGADGTTYMITADGNYSLKLFNALGCASYSDTLPVILSSVAGLIELPFTVYPNPAKESLNISLSQGLTGSLSMEWFDVLGRSVHRTKEIASGNTMQLDVSMLSPGLYMLQLRGEGLVGEHKVLIE